MRYACSDARPKLFCLLLVALGVIITGSISQSAHAQELRKTLNDYHSGRPFQYQPSDPFVRSKAFQVQTKHYGLFYNCDGEECKRNSPHICWKTHHEKDLPTKMTALQRIKHELNQVKQRVYDGAGMCASGGCDCQQCQSVQSVPTSNNGGCDCGQCGDGTVVPQDSMMIIGKLNTRLSDEHSSPESQASVAATTRIRSSAVKVTVEKQQVGLVGMQKQSEQYPWSAQGRTGTQFQVAPKVATRPDDSALMLERLRRLQR